MENNFRIDSASISDRGLSNKRPNNEDSFLELNHKGVFAVADGVGGAQAGDVASQMAMEILGEAFNNLKPSDDAEELMKLAIERANSAIYQMSQDLPQLATMATTIVAVHLSGNIGTIGHVGDSRLYRLDENGNLYRETADHSVVEEEVRAGRMTVSQAANHPSRNVISRALGAESDVQVDLKTIMFEPGTTFLVCSDGITRHIDDFEIRELLASGEKSAQICQRMKEICYERGAEDNLTAVIARVSSTVEGSSPVVIFENEQQTIASARATADASDEPRNILELDDEVPTSQLEMPASQDYSPIELEVAHIPEPQQMNHAEEFEEEISYTESAPPVEEAVIEVKREVEHQPPTVKEYESKPYDVIEIEENNFLSKILLGIFAFLIGAVIGAGAIYLYIQNNPVAAVPVAPPDKTEDVLLSSFEVLRRSVDDDPEGYISKYAPDPRDAEDFFLLGRANMLVGKFPEAKKALLESQNRLATAGDGNAYLLANDIAAYLSIVDNPAAQKAFTAEADKGKNSIDAAADAEEANANVKGNSNTNQ